MRQHPNFLVKPLNVLIQNFKSKMNYHTGKQSSKIISNLLSHFFKLKIAYHSTKD